MDIKQPTGDERYKLWCGTHADESQGISEAVPEGMPFAFDVRGVRTRLAIIRGLAGPSQPQKCAELKDRGTPCHPGGPGILSERRYA